MKTWFEKQKTKTKKRLKSKKPGDHQHQDQIKASLLSGWMQEWRYPSLQASTRSGIWL
jgi:hypothetical protein